LRKGFVLGGGLGIAPVVSWELDVAIFDVKESKAGIGSNFLIGYGWDEQNLIVFEGNGASTSTDQSGADQTISQGFGGPVWYHYLKPVAPTFFTALGAGFYGFQFEDDRNDSGFGWLGGCGFEFSRHWQFTIVAHGGQTESAAVDFSHLTVSVLVGGVAF
jgi:hypothetical protein